MCKTHTCTLTNSLSIFSISSYPSVWIIISNIVNLYEKKPQTDNHRREIFLEHQPSE